MLTHHPQEPEGNRLRDAWDRYVGRGLSTYTPTRAVVERAEGSLLWTTDGRKLYDFASGVLVTNLGHGHGGFEARLADYRKGLPRSAYNFMTRVQVEASRRLVEACGSKKLAKTLGAASGSEGIQKAMWACLRRYPGRPVLLATRGGFHGKKGLAGDVTGMHSANPNVQWVSFPQDDGTTPETVQGELEALWEAHGGRIALLITEPYLGAAGSYHPPKWYHALLQRWCNANEVPFVFDEVQSCFGRTGNMFAFQSYEVEPDLVVLGKGLANGEPAAAVVGRADLIDALDYGEASDTFSATPNACAAVCACLDVFAEENIVQRGRDTGAKLYNALCSLQERFSFITAVRGEGMVYGLEMRDEDTANRCVLEAYYGVDGEGVHFLGPLAGKVLRVSPPLTLTDEELSKAIALIDRAWERMD